MILLRTKISLFYRNVKKKAGRLVTNEPKTLNFEFRFVNLISFKGWSFH
jgi:hypothetical protein